MPNKVIIIGPAHPYRGGLASFDERLALEFQREGSDVTIYNFTLQYPGFLFPGSTQYSDEPAPEHIRILRKINSVNPFNWWKIGRELKQLKPDIIVVRFWIPFMGPALGTILKQVRENNHTKIIAITDNVIPHEKRPGDKPFTRYLLSVCNGFITMSNKVLADLKQFDTVKPAVQVVHPLYDNFGNAVNKEDAKAKLQLRPNDCLLLFFGFIRQYKGLDLLLDAVKILIDQQWKPQHQSWKLIIAGEFYEDKTPYMEQINKLGIADRLILQTNFIPNQHIKYYFSAADVVIQPYKNATQSGVTPLAYHFNKPMIVSNVGALPDYVPHQKVGLVAEPNAAAMANAIIQYFELGEEYFKPGLLEEKKRYLWSNLTTEIRELSKSITT